MVLLLLKFCAHLEYLGNSYSSLKTQVMHHILWKAHPEGMCTRWYFLSSVMNEPTALLPLQLLNQDFRLLHVFSLSPCGNGYLKFCLPLTILHSFCVRETGSHRQTNAGPLGGILWTIVVVLFFLGT